MTVIAVPLAPIIAAYAAEGAHAERLGDFVIRAGFVARSGNGRDFHADVGAERAR
jgi:sulfite reductase (NADPH) hemoprotein beta-component